MSVGAWGDAGDTILCILPIILVLVLTLIPPHLPAHKSLPSAALVLYLIHLGYLGTSGNVVHAAALAGALNTLTPLLIVASAMFLFETLNATYCMPWITEQLAKVSHNNCVAQVFLILFAFQYLIEGCSGFGTPVQLAAPLMIALGFPPKKVLVVALSMNGLMTIYGAAGTPLTFGFSGIGLSDDQLKTIGFRASLINGIIAFFFPILAARFLVTWREMLRSYIFVLVTTIVPVVVAIALSKFTLEFPSLLGGLAGLLVSSTLVGFGWGVEKCGVNRTTSSMESRMDIESDYPAHELQVPSSRFQPFQRAKRKMEALRRKQEMVAGITNENRSESECSSRDTENVVIVEDVCAGDSSGILEPGSLQRFAEHRALGTDANRVREKDEEALDTHAIGIPNHQEDSVSRMDVKERPIITRLLTRTLPLWGSIVLLLFTRVNAIGLKSLLRRTRPGLTINFRTLGRFRLSAALVFELQDIYGVDSASWKLEFLYIPAFLPFVFTSLLSILYFSLYVKSCRFGSAVGHVTKRVCSRLKKPAIALTSALIFVGLLRAGDEESPAFIIGDHLASALGKGWLVLSILLGGLGSFFSGSTTVSNLTFGNVQQVAAKKIDVNVESILALQTVGATAGNMICLANIVNAAAVIGMPELREGKIIKKTGPLFLLYWILAASIGALLILAIF